MTTLRLQDEIRDALADGHPVVALESTVIAHGLPHPANLETATAMEQEIRRHGAVPATIAVMNGVPCIGLSASEMERLALEDNIRKCSRRDLPIACARGETGATTVAATMILADMAGIRIFATGGIGGVHRGPAMDISSDLHELASHPLGVVCAGAKAILDLPATLEVLETFGVPVIGYGTDTFPAFFTRSSGLPVDTVCRTPDEAAAIMISRDRLGFRQAVLITVPLPDDVAIDRETAGRAIEQALKEADERGVKGKDITPFLLGRVDELTGHASLKANISLLLQNARVAALTASALARASRGG